MESEPKYKKWINFSVYLGLSLSFSDVVDRCFGDYNFNLLVDLSVVTISMFIGFKKNFPLTYKKLCPIKM